ncbi:MAG: hypothetical protein ACHQRJ_04320 [Alphaproteobacteria bacterium]
MATDDSVSAKIKAAFDCLPLPDESEERIAERRRTVNLLALMTDNNPKAGRPPAMFRDAANSTCAKELARFARQARKVLKLASCPQKAGERAQAAKRLDATIGDLHKPTILALANAGFGCFGEREALCRIAHRIAEAEGGLSEEEVRILQQAVECAHRADVYAIPKSLAKGPPVNNRVRKVGKILLDAYEELTDKKATVIVKPDDNKASGPFLKLVRDVLAALNIEASAEAVARQAIARKKTT